MVDIKQNFKCEYSLMWIIAVGIHGYNEYTYVYKDYYYCTIYNRKKQETLILYFTKGPIKWGRSYTDPI